ncbi:MAG TPA: polymer-forming cytoskeletal protein [Rhizomicrobium sp.]|jgi:cytoskeletal protein CcmA (bactofilin family)|nr:polymer-forming cytoskeletal protein [Rhizomicrobium sp.]
MSVFNRNDKPDTSVSNTPATPAGAPTPEPVKAEVKPQAIAQPISSVSPSAVSRSQGVSVISKALKITGQLESTEDIQVDGEIDGDVRGVTVKVGNNAKVKGTVFADEVELSGTVDGKIEAKKVVLTSTARMTGDVVHQDIQISSGAYIDGHLKPEYGKTSAKVRAAE